MATILGKDQATYAKERDVFLRDLQHFHEIRGTPFKRAPTLGGKEVDLYLLYTLVTSQGGWLRVVAIFGICGTCRKQELKNLKLGDINDSCTMLLVRIPGTKTKVPRSFVISGNFYKICKQYIDIRQQVSDPQISQFFLIYQRGKCTKQVVGLNKIGGVPKQIAEYLKLPDPKEYTGHCLRRTSATLLVDAGGDLMTLKRHGGWKSSTTAEGYVDDSINNKTLTANRIINSVKNNLQTFTYTENSNVQKEYTIQSTSSQNLPDTFENPKRADKGIVINNCQNFTINYYK